MQIISTDAAGNSDTVFIYVAEGATDGLDPEFGELNLYKVPMSIGKETDLRIVQRTDTNYITDKEKTPSLYYDVFWLHGYHREENPAEEGVSVGWLPPYKENVDLKANYVANDRSERGSREFAFQLRTTRFPVTFFVEHRREVIQNHTMRITSHDTINGKNNWGLIEYFAIPPDPEIKIPENFIFYFNLPSYNTEFDPAESIILILFEAFSANGIKDNKIDDNTLIYLSACRNYVVMEETSMTTYNLFDNTGTILKTFNIESVPYQLDISDLPIGIYFIVDKARSIFYKFIKQ